MTIQQLVDNYQATVKNHHIALQAWQTANKPLKEYRGWPNYNWYGEQLIITLREEFGLSDKQAGYIYARAYEDYHACFGDIFWGAHELAGFVMGFCKL